jgi:hypothetical protein
MLRIVAKASGGEIGQEWNLIRPASHRLRHLPRSLPGVAREALRRCSRGPRRLAIADPHKAVAVDVAASKNPLLPGGFLVSGLVYDVTTGRIELVVPSPWRASAPCTPRCGCGNQYILRILLPRSQIDSHLRFQLGFINYKGLPRVSEIGRIMRYFYQGEVVALRTTRAQVFADWRALKAERRRVQ